MPSIPERVYGQIFCGVILNVFLYGITLTQTYLYFNLYKTDKPWLKILVMVLFVIDTANMVCDIMLIYDPVVNNWGNPEVLVKGTTLLGTDPSLAAGITVMVQLFFAWRVKVLTGNKWTVYFIVVGAIAGFAGALGTGIWITIVTEYEQMRKFKPVAILWIVAASSVDIAITTTLVMYLRRNKTGMSATDDVVDRLIRMTVQTGLITSICAIADLAAYLISPSTAHLIFNLPLPKLYTNTLMSTLNARRGWQRDGSDHMTVHPTSMGLRTTTDALAATADSNKPPQAGQEIFVNVESHEMVDSVDAKGVQYPGSTTTLPTFSDKKTMETIAEPPTSSRPSTPEAGLGV